MSEQLPKNTPEIPNVIDDNARKFVSEVIDTQFLAEHNATSFNLTVDWLETGEDNEKKLAYKEYDSGDIQILLISKHTVDSKRSTMKDKLTNEEYRQLLNTSVLRVQKRRHEFEYTQNDATFTINYDEFTASGLRVVEVDAPTDKERAAFNLSRFPVGLVEVTGDISYYGYRVADII